MSESVRPLANPELLRELIERMPEAIFVADADSGILLDANQTACDLLGRSRTSLVGQHHTCLHPPRTAPQSSDNFAEHAHGDPSVPMIDQLVLSDGTLLPIEVLATPIAFAGRALLVGQFRDLSTRAETHQAFAEQQLATHRHFDALVRVAIDLPTLAGNDFTVLCQSVNRLVANAVESQRVSVWLVSADGRSLDCVDLYTEGEHSAGVSLSADDFPRYFDALRSQRAIAAHDAHTDPGTSEFSASYLTPLGIASMLDAPIRVGGELAGVLCLEHTGSMRHWTGQEVAFASSVADQLAIQCGSQRNQALVERLQASENHLRITLEVIGDAVITVDRSWLVEHLNPAAVALTGWAVEAAKGRAVGAVVDLRDSEADVPTAGIVSRFQAEGAFHSDLAVLTASDRVRREVSVTISPITDAEARPVGAVLVLRDISRQVAMEERLRQSQKMDAVGQLAGGIAHDFNNMLAGILGSAELLRSRSASDAVFMRLTGSIITAAERAADLTSKLLTFSRRAPVDVAVVDVHTVVSETLSLLGRSIDRRITVHTALSAASATVVGDSAELQSALLNLCINARDAMPDGGRLDLATRLVDLDDAWCSLSPFDLAPGRFVEIQVTDTGCGIPAEATERIFEPFFSTKPVGAGTGLGLAAVYGVVVDHHGAIQLTSEVGRGTTFTMLLPSSQSAAPPSESTGVMRLETETVTVLVVDDEPTLRTAVELGLEDLGYRVLTAEDGQQALDVYREQGDHIDVVLLDTVMPRMNGPEALRELRRIDPSVRVVMSSGFTRDTSIGDLKDAGALEFIKKPYARKALAEVLARVVRQP